MWKEENGKTTFTGGKEAYQDAARIAEQCPLFTEDCEEECVTDDPRSCYNCRYRRLTIDIFVFMKGDGQ